MRHEPPPVPLSERERVARLRLIRTENVGPMTFRMLIERFGSADRAIEALPDLALRGGRRRPLAVPGRAAAEAPALRATALGWQVRILPASGAGGDWNDLAQEAAR